MTAAAGSAGVRVEATVKGYRELLKRLRNSKEETSPSSSIFLQAKTRAFATLQNRRQRNAEDYDPRRALKQLKDRLLNAKQDLKLLKEAKRGRLKAAYTALVDQHRLDSAEKSTGAAGDDADILGHDNLLRKLVLATVGGMSKGFMSLLTSTEIQGRDVLRDAFARPSDVGMITVSNHTAALDDPLLLAALMPADSIHKPHLFRWGMCATDRCFKSDLMSAFFRAGKTLPVERGKGCYQAGIRAAQQRLKAGDWVHIFPEGTRSRNGKMGVVRRGIGHIIASCDPPPLVVPFAHSGMEEVLPPGSSFPRAGQRVRIHVGAPICFEDLLYQAKAEEWSHEILSVNISQCVATKLYSLKTELEGLPERAASPTTAEMGKEALEEGMTALIQDQMHALTHSWRKASQADESWSSGFSPITPTFASARQKSRGQGLEKLFSMTAAAFAEPNSNVAALQTYLKSRRNAMTNLALYHTAFT